jgi:hypothetical protein
MGPAPRCLVFVPRRRPRRGASRTTVLASFLAGLLIAAGCGGDDAPSEPPDAAPDPAPDAAPDFDVADACNPLGTTACLLPWPSAAYLRQADTATGVALDLPSEAMPVGSLGLPADPAPFNRFDGFAPSGPLIVAFPAGVSPAGLPSPDKPEDALAADAPIVLLDMDSGARVPYFAEVDANAIFPEDRVLIVRPLARLRPGTRHAVAIRKSLRAADEGELPVPPGFQAILDGRAVEHPRMERLAARADDVFAALQAAGVPRDDLVLAWDFVTASDELLTADLLHMRAKALAVIGENGASLTFQAEEQAIDSPLVLRYLVGTYQSPDFLTSGEDAESVLRRDAEGLPEDLGLRDARFAALVPACVAAPDTPLPRPVLVFGHGLFGNGADSLRNPGLHALAEASCVVLVAGDFIGLTSRQVEVGAQVAADIDKAPRITEKLAQSVIDFLALAQVTRGPLAGDPRFQVPDQPDDRPIIDPDQVYYFGASLGGIMGLVVMAYDASLPRGVLGVPGGAWSLLLERSLAWGPLQAVALSAYTRPFDYQMLVALLGMHFEPYDSITTAARITADPLPDTPVKQVLLYQAMGDSLVNNLATEMVARSMALPVLAPSVRVPGGMTEQVGPLDSGLVIYDEHPEPLPPTGNLPPAEDNGTHGAINTRPAVTRQVVRFLLEGTLVHECRDGDTDVPCDCTTGACD